MCLIRFLADLSGLSSHFFIFLIGHTTLHWFSFSCVCSGCNAMLWCLSSGATWLCTILFKYLFFVLVCSYCDCTFLLGLFFIHNFNIDHLCRCVSYFVLRCGLWGIVLLMLVLYLHVLHFLLLFYLSLLFLSCMIYHCGHCHHGLLLWHMPMPPIFFLDSYSSASALLTGHLPIIYTSRSCKYNPTGISDKVIVFNSFILSYF